VGERESEREVRKRERIREREGIVGEKEREDVCA